MKTSQYLVALSCCGLAAACQPDHAPATAAAHRAQPAPLVAAARPSTPPLAAASRLDTVADARLLAIRRLVAGLNTQPRRAWSAVRKIDVYETSEGGDAVFYYLGHELRKISARQLGEMGQARAEYYLLHGQPAFVFERTYHYNRPIYYDAATMRENHDTEAFDFAKSTVTASRSYSYQGQLFYQAGPQARDSVAVPGYYQREQQRLAAQLRYLLAQADSSATTRP